MSDMTQRYFRLFAATIILTLIACISINAQQVPPAPSQDYDRFGSYFWTTTYKAYDRLRVDAPLSCSSLGNRQLIDTLSPGKDLVASLGTRTIRAVIGNYGGRYSHNYEPGGIAGCPGTVTLKQWVQGAEYTSLFTDSRFTTYILTYFPDGWQTVTTDASGKKIHHAGDYTGAYTQMKDLVEYLVGQENGSFRFPGKTFILLNWEADSQLESYINDPKFISGTATRDDSTTSNPVYGSFWDEYEKAIRASSAGVKGAIKPSGANQPKVYFGLEFSKFNRLRDPAASDYTFVHACGSGNPQSPDDRMEWRCAMSYLPSRLNTAGAGYSTPAQIDYWSYSAWDTTSNIVPNPDLNLSQKVRDDLTLALGWTNVNQPSQSSYQARNLIIGEFGYQDNRVGDFDNNISPRGIHKAPNKATGHWRIFERLRYFRLPL